MDEGMGVDDDVKAGVGMAMAGECGAPHAVHEDGGGIGDGPGLGEYCYWWWLWR